MSSTLQIRFTIGPASRALAKRLEATFPHDSEVVFYEAVPTVDDDGAPTDGPPVRTWHVDCHHGLRSWARADNDAAQAIIAELIAEQVPFQFFCQGDIEENPAILDWEPGVAGPVAVRSADLDGHPTLSEHDLRRMRAEHEPLTEATKLELFEQIAERLRPPADPAALTYPRNAPPVADGCPCLRSDSRDGTCPAPPASDGE